MEFRDPLQVVEYAESESNRGAAWKFQVDEWRVREWRSQKAALEQHSSKKKRLPGGGRKAVFSDALEEELLEWIGALRRQHLQVTCTAIQRKAIVIYESRNLREDEADTPFEVSRGWLQKFLKRQEFTIRCRTTVSQRML